jgi:SAM-dependent methyltransferase
MTAGSTPSKYAFDNNTVEAENQLRYIGETVDSHTRATLKSIGVAAGWECWDVGAGAGTVAQWLAERVGPSGHVLASDLKPQHIPARDNLKTLKHDVRIDPYPSDGFDLIHARLLLMHLPAREEIVHRLVSALNPGGFLVLSDWETDYLDLVLDSPDEAATGVFKKFLEICRAGSPAAGIDTRWAPRANSIMRKAGLTEITTEIHAESWAGGTGACLLHHSNTIQLQSGLLNSGLDEKELQKLREVLLDPRFVISSHLMFTTFGTLPG